MRHVWKHLCGNSISFWRSFVSIGTWLQEKILIIAPIAQPSGTDCFMQILHHLCWLIALSQFVNLYRGMGAAAPPASRPEIYGSIG